MLRVEPRPRRSTYEAPPLPLLTAEPIDGTVTIRLSAVPWERAFEAVLESHGLWYRYSEQGKLVVKAFPSRLGWSIRRFKANCQPSESIAMFARWGKRACLNN